MWLYDVFEPWLHDVLDEPAGDVTTQVANGALTFSGGATQDWPGAFDQPLDGTLELYGGALQFWSAPAAAQAYVQQGNLIIVFTGDAPQEHSPVFGGQDGQTGNGVITFSGNVLQSHTPGANAGEYLQIGDGALTFLGDATHIHALSLLSLELTQILESVQPYGSQPVPAVRFDFGSSPSSVSRIVMTFGSADEVFQAGVGPNGGQVFVELALRNGATRVPLVSVSVDKPSAEFFAGQSAAAFNSLASDLADGVVDMEVRAYEALAHRVAPRTLGTSSLQIEVLP